jgi:long-chain acyl-CoA synthetase
MTDANLVALHRRQAERYGPRPALRGKRLGLWRDLSWGRYRADALAAAAALAEAGVRPGDRVGLLAENRVDWLVADMAILSAGAVNVPPHAPLTARQVHYQLSDAGCVFLIVSDAAQLAKARQVLPELPLVREVVVFERGALQTAEGGHSLVDSEDKRAAASSLSADRSSRPTSTWEAFLQRGRRALPRLRAELERREAALGGDDLATVMYTSGTTGNPKGVMLTHGNLLSNAAATLESCALGPASVVLNWLPLTHIYARLVDHYAGMLAGGLLCLAECADTLIDDLADTQPTNFAAVPRFYEKVLAARASPDPQETGRRLRKVFGPRVDWLSSGGAPLPPDVCRAYHDAGLLLLQGYGLTESSPVISFNTKKAYKIETVGRPIPGVAVKIAPDGEILTRGPHVMKGYWNDPAATAAALRDGWLHTGDLGELDADGFLKITGRKKEILVLSNGKKVSPACLEGLLLADPCVDQALVCGEGKSYLTALLVPHWDNVRKELAAQGVDVPADGAAAGHPAVQALLEEVVRRRLADVSHGEQVRKFVVLAEPFSVVRDELTVSLKMRRNVILAHHAGELEEMYRSEE